jgi:hypothetical protein
VPPRAASVMRPLARLLVVLLWTLAAPWHEARGVVVVVSATEVLPAPVVPGVYVIACRRYVALGNVVYIVANYTLGSTSADAYQLTTTQHSDRACVNPFLTRTITTGTFALETLALAVAAMVTGAATVGNATAVAAWNVSVSAITIETSSIIALGVINNNCPGVAAAAGAGFAINTPIDLFTLGCPAFGLGSASTCVPSACSPPPHPPHTHTTHTPTHTYTDGRDAGAMLASRSAASVGPVATIA